MKTAFIEFSKDKTIPSNLEKEYSGKNWIYWGEDNLYPIFLVELFYNSSIHNGIIRNKVNYITGSGFEYNKNETTNKIINNGTHDKDLNDVIGEIALDYELVNGICLKIVRSIDGNLAYIDSMPIEKMRTNENETEFYFSDNWKVNTQDEKTNFKVYPAFSPNENQPCSILYFAQTSKNYLTPKSGRVFNVYPTPIYKGGIQDIMASIEISNFHYYEIVNGFKGGTIMTFTNGVPEDVERRKIENDIKDMVAMENSGGVFLSFVDSADQLPDIKNMIGNDMDKRYSLLEEQVKKNIFVSHSIVSSVLFGVTHPNALGNKSEMEVAFEIFKKTYVRQRQTDIERLINWLYKQFGIELGLKMNEPEMPFTSESAKLQPALPTTQFSKEDMEQRFFELAGKLGVTELPQGKSYTFGAEEMWEQKQKFEMTTTDLSFLKMYLTDMNIVRIAEAIGITNREAMGIYEKLKTEGYIEKGLPTSKAIKILAETDNQFKVETFYHYEEIPGIPTAASGSRPFCQMLMGLNRFYTRQEVEQLNAYAPLGNVFLWRGGWYHNPETDRTTLGCRHRWASSVVIKSK